MRFVHELEIQRSTKGARDDYGHAANTWATTSRVHGLVQPKSIDEINQANQAGPVVADHSIYLPATAELDEADRLVYAGATYEIDGIERRDYGRLRHLKVNARRVH